MTDLVPDARSRVAATLAEATFDDEKASRNSVSAWKPFNRKNPKPSADMTPSDGHRYRCHWIEESITVHSDGNVSCGLDDPHAQRSFGNVKFSPIEEIFGNPEYLRLQDRLWNGHRCRDCALYRQVDADSEPPPPRRPSLPRALVVETTVNCNIRCPNPSCIPNNDQNAATRDSRSLSLETLAAIADQLEGVLETVHFYNYGEPFMHRQAEDMLLHLRQRCPDALIVTSTNGIPLSNPTRAEKVVLAAPDRVVFTIGGIKQDTYSRYHVAGKADQALAGLKNVCEAKRKHGQKYPATIWRYLVFHWNDSDAEIDAAITLAQEYGVDRFSLFLTDVPQGARSVKFSPGSPSYYKYADYIHHDDVGRLDQAYSCDLPNENGLFGIEEIPELGRARRTSSVSTLRRDGLSRRLRFSVSTDRALSRGQNHTCSFETPWRTFEVPLTYGKWRRVSIRIPPAFRGPNGFDVKLTTADYWFPSAERNEADLRCLGFLVRAEAAWQYFLQRRTPPSVKKFWDDHIVQTAFGRITSDIMRSLFPPPPTDEPFAASSAARKFVSPVERLYSGLLGRPADSAGLNGWVGALRSGNWSLAQVATFFVSSAEFRAVHGENPTPEAFVDALRQRVGEGDLGDADSQDWVDYLQQRDSAPAAMATAAIDILRLTEFTASLHELTDRAGRSLTA